MRLILFCLVLSISLVSCYRKLPPLRTGMEGKPIPAFNLLLRDSSTVVNMGALPKGKPVVLVFISPNCPFCRAEVDGIVKNMATLKDIQFYVFTNWPLQMMKAFSDHYQLNKYPNVTVGYDYTDFFQTHFRVGGVPYTAIYTKENTLTKAFAGKLDSRQIKDEAQD